MYTLPLDAHLLTLPMHTFSTSFHWAGTSLLKTPVFQPGTNIERAFMCVEQVLGVFVFAFTFSQVRPFSLLSFLLSVDACLTKTLSMPFL